MHQQDGSHRPARPHKPYRGKWSFCVERPQGDLVNVVVASRLGRKYLKRTADGDAPKNLLSLAECP